MAERRPVRLTPQRAPATQTRPVAGGGTSGQSNNGCLAVAAIIGVLVVVAKCSSSTTGSSPATPAAENVGNAQQALVSAVADQTPPPVQALSPTSTRRGLSRVATAAREGLAGEMIYSQNCYDVVGRRFTWAKLDECGGFDIEASLALGDDEPAGAEREIAWFDGEAAAGRYLKAATAAGLDADAADRRLEELQRRVGARHKPKAAPTSTPSAEPDDGGLPVDADGNEAAAA